MTSAQVSRLERLRYHSTLYELAFDGNILVGYCKYGKRSILNMVQRNGQDWADRFGQDARIDLDRNGRGATLEGHRISFTGRTEREAICGGELPWFKDAIPVINKAA